jgi:hypothetical protein
MKSLNDSGECNIFDLSKVDRYKKCRNKNKLGCVKYESGNNPIVEAVFPQVKMYATLHAKPDEDDKEGDAPKVDKKGKGIPNRVLERLYGFEAYKKTLFCNESEKASFFAFRSSNHIVKHCNVVRQGISADNDKVFIVGPEASRPLGHYRNALHSDAEPNPKWDLSSDLINREQREVLDAAYLIFSNGLAGPPEGTAALALEEDESEHQDEDCVSECGHVSEQDAFDELDLLM